MTPLMQTICDELRTSCLEHYIDGFHRDVYDMELDRLYCALTDVLPESCQELLKHYVLILRARSLLDTEAMFQAAFAAARELA